MGILFGVDRTVIVRHIGNIYKSGELSEESTCAKIAQVQNEGGRSVRRIQKYYDLDVILSVGFRVNSSKAIYFRRWASKILKDYRLGGHLISSRMDTLEKRVSQVEEKMDLFVNASEESANQERPTWLLAVCKAHQPADPCLKIGVFAA